MVDLVSVDGAQTLLRDPAPRTDRKRVWLSSYSPPRNFTDEGLPNYALTFPKNLESSEIIA